MLQALIIIMLSPSLLYIMIHVHYDVHMSGRELRINKFKCPFGGCVAAAYHFTNTEPKWLLRCDINWRRGKLITCAPLE